MSLDTYTNLKAEIINWSHRDDMALEIDTFINLAETEMFANQLEPLRLRGGETRAAFSTSITTRFASLPTGYQSSRKLRIQITDGGSFELRFRTPSQLNILSTVGCPQFFTITDQIEFNRISDTVYTGEIQYFQEFTALSSSNSSNFVLSGFPNLYLFGSLWALMLHVEQFDKAAVYYQQFLFNIKGANNKDSLGRYGPAPVMRVEGPTP